eukprot:43115-Prorocentrum_minimum.AAC.1
MIQPPLSANSPPFPPPFEQEEERRLAHVAVTRAKEKLYLTCARAVPLRGGYIRALPSSLPLHHHQQDAGKFTPYELDFAPSELEFAPSALEFAPSELDFAPSELEFAPFELGFAPSELGFAPSELDFAPSELEFAPSELHFAPSKREFTLYIRALPSSLPLHH